jgi:hypothetical protein
MLFLKRTEFYDAAGKEGRMIRLKRYLYVAFCALISLQLVSCGTILYPERRGQREGQVDVAVVLMDGIGLFFFIIPGVIAFAVDFSTGAIYLPSGKHSRRSRADLHSFSDEKARVVNVDPRKLNADTIARILADNTEYPVRLDDPALVVVKAKEPVDVDQELARLTAEQYGQAGHSDSSMPILISKRERNASSHSMNP